MSKEINSILIDARLKELEAEISNAMYLEHIESKGQTPTDVISSVKSRLSIADNELVGLIGRDKTKVLFENLQNLRHVTKLINNLKSNIAETSEIEVLTNIQSKLAKVSASQLDIEIEDLYEVE